MWLCVRNHSSMDSCPTSDTEDSWHTPREKPPLQVRNKPPLAVSGYNLGLVHTHNPNSPAIHPLINLPLPHTTSHPVLVSGLELQASTPTKLNHFTYSSIYVLENETSKYSNLLASGLGKKSNIISGGQIRLEEPE